MHACTHIHVQKCVPCTHLLTCTLTYSLTLSLTRIHHPSSVSREQYVLLKSNTFFCCVPDRTVIMLRSGAELCSGLWVELTMRGALETQYSWHGAFVQHIKLINKEVYDSRLAQRGDILSRSKCTLITFILLPLKTRPLLFRNCNTCTRSSVLCV